MSGHSKWSTIKHKKAATDAKRGKLFTRMAKTITIAAREGGGDLEFNNSLILAVERAKAANMPKENIERAIKRGTGELDGGELVESLYEVYGPHGIAILIEAITDNRNRAIAEVRHVTGKYGGTMADAGSVAWQFTRKGYISITEEVDEDELFMAAAEAGADDIQFGGVTEIFVAVDALQTVRQAVVDASIRIEEASLIYDPNNPIELDQKDTLQVMRLIEKFEDLEDAQNVYSTLEITDEAIAAMEEA